MTKRTKRKGERLDKDARIVIVGNGLGGLSTALALEQAGFTNIQIYERDAATASSISSISSSTSTITGNNSKQPQRQRQRQRHKQQHERKGYGLTLSYNPKGPLAELGLLESVVEQDCPSRSHYQFAPNGTIRAYYGNAFAAAPCTTGSHTSRTTTSTTGSNLSHLYSHGLGQRGNVRIPRHVLLSLMREKVQSSISYGKKFVRYSYQNQKEPHHEVLQENVKTRMNDASYTATTTTTTITTDHGRPIHNDHNDGLLTIMFDDGTMETNCSLLIGADGIRSSVLKQWIPNSISTLKYMGIFILLGISDFYNHPLLDECGFYTLDGTHRLFTMPYEGSKLDDAYNDPHHVDDDEDDDDIMNDDDNKGTDDTAHHGSTHPRTHCRRRRRIMWQLSFTFPSEMEAEMLSKSGPKALQQEVLRRCQTWHDPVLPMIHATPLETIWGTGLYDRDPQQVLDQLSELKSHSMKTTTTASNSTTATTDRVVVLGDAWHSMSPFKGAGANQALLDGPLLVQWLQRASLSCALSGFLREMTVRTHVKVTASRQAAMTLHSIAAIELSSSSSSSLEFAGVDPKYIASLLEKLKDLNIGAHDGAALNDKVRSVIQANHFFKDVNNDLQMDTTIQQCALQMAREGNVQGLRTLSLQRHAYSIHTARTTDNNDDGNDGRTCLHLAVQAGEYYTCRWLLTELFMNPNIPDKNGRTAYQLALQLGATSATSNNHDTQNNEDKYDCDKKDDARRISNMFQILYGSSKS